MFCVTRPINGVPINGKEYLLNDDDTLMLFDTEEAARLFLQKNGFSEKDIQEAGLTIEEAPAQE